MWFRSHGFSVWGKLKQMYVYRFWRFSNVIYFETTQCCLLTLAISLTYTHSFYSCSLEYCCCCWWWWSCNGNIRDNRLPLSSKSNRHFCFFFLQEWDRWEYLMTINRHQINIISLKLCTWLVELISQSENVHFSVKLRYFVLTTVLKAQKADTHTHTNIVAIICGCNYFLFFLK